MAARGTVLLGASYHPPQAVSGAAAPIGRQPNCCRISVADTGPGIAPEFQQEIFEEYFRLTTAGTGQKDTGSGWRSRAASFKLLAARYGWKANRAMGASFRFSVC